MNESQVTDSHDIVTDIARIEPQAQKPKSREKNRGCHWKSLRNTKYKLPKRILTTCYFGRSEGLFFFFLGGFLPRFFLEVQNRRFDKESGKILILQVF